MAETTRQEECYSITELCVEVGMSRQNYYAVRRERKHREIDEEMILRWVREERKQHPRIGGRKLLHMIRHKLQEAGISIGRDEFFKLLSKHDLLIAPKAKSARTTNSRHSLPVFHNRLAGREISHANEAWVSDLTYIRTDEGFLYAALITDVFSRKIVGAHIGDTLEAEGCLAALEQALGDLPPSAFPLHHSDRGCQYCCHAYVERLQSRGLEISMTEIMHCYENAMAERVNGILKLEYGLDHTFRTKAQAKEAFEQAVRLYNYRRPHLSLNYRVPAEVHAEAA